MTIPTQQYANLAEQSYGDDRKGHEGQWLHPVQKVFELEGVKYKALEYMDRPSGYQGAIYQRIDTGEIVVAHRGTEGGRELKLDGLIADGGMVAKGVNSQVKDALELTEHALKFAKSSTAKYGHTPEVTTTGHSLGGTLAQVTAHKYGLRGEAFNPYGAASLNYGVPEGGHRFVNHVMAGCTVSAGSPQYGEVRVYAKPVEIASLAAGGYDNTSLPTDLHKRNPLTAAGLSMLKGQSHNMDNFLNVDADGKKDVSILRDPKAQALAKQYDPMIDKYRGDVGSLRAGITLSVAAGEKIVELHGKAVDTAIKAGVKTGQFAVAVGEKVVDLHVQAAKKTVEVGVYTGKKAVEAGEKVVDATVQAGKKAVEVGEHVGKKAVEVGEQVGKKASELGEKASKKAQEVGDAIGDFFSSRPAAVGAAGTALLTSNPLAFVKQMTQAHAAGDQETFRAMTQSAANHGAGQQLHHQASATVDRLEHQQAAERSAAQQQQQQQHETAQPSHGGRSR
ncbi:hypothetical protein [Pseudomonas sp. CGJS7]|uniref:hypothetical protein n=1 Tax=Pseudomonas sp. CGJS7 TaxID=3109348 RepID=UPI00300AB3BF